MNHGLDTDDRVCFSEQEFYPLSNFSAFAITWRGYRFDTSEHAYHWDKFPPDGYQRLLGEESAIAHRIRLSTSAHEAFKLAEREARFRRPDWDDVKVSVMRDILRAKVEQHEYVRRKLSETGDRELVENSWRDSFWGWGEDRNGLNMLGKLWMEIRAEFSR